MLPTLLLAVVISAEPARPFTIKVIDERTERGVPLIELRTVHGIRLWTDSNGLIAFNEPGLMNETVFFAVSGHGYEHAKDGFGYRGVRLAIKPGGAAMVKVTRVNVAERLYRLTGAGIYGDSETLGVKAPLKEPLLNGRVLGSDSVMNAVYRGKVYWFWGDTNQPSYPLGNFHVPGAVSELPNKGGLNPDAGVNLAYFVDDKGFAKKTCDMPGAGPTWIEALTTIVDDKGRERLYAWFVKVKPPMTVYARGLALFDDETNQFVKVRELDVNMGAVPRGHAFHHRVGEQAHIYFASPYPMVRVPATEEALRDPARYESFTCLKAGSKLDEAMIERDDAGKSIYAWKPNTPVIGPTELQKLVKSGKMSAGESPFDLYDRDTGRAVFAHAGSVCWNDFRKRWVMIATELYGQSSLLGEVWYAEADAPEGPWRCARQVVSHEKYSFYNPKQHPMFDQKGGQHIYFEGTYTHTFSGNNDVTPRYDYNQIMYRLDLDDPRVALPRTVPGASYLALDRDVPGTLPLPGQHDPLKPFYILRPAKNAPAATVPLFEFKRGDERRYDIVRTLEGFERNPMPLGHVWPARPQRNSR